MHLLPSTSPKVADGQMMMCSDGRSLTNKPPVSDPNPKAAPLSNDVNAIKFA
ncbi:hypothetical protein [Bradyrhizobium sp. WSM471]|uniref:hypothetical protein n=1 Tax=Bradyrhizobium sp. WSM471 TaxID=319017 RepID=UPI00024D1AB2|nr:MULTISPECIES: hypothetical protein [Bradyrhizobium]EHR00189.1 hypothetical protein Bra471DRAFT_00735 [Bradyrhizobium sp. WSM471]UFW42310.1 hypothetical protein BcanWSM471_03620 [Bradyrhizobium canariense]